MKYLVLASLFFLISCSKNFDKPNPLATTKAEKESCNFGLSEFNLTKRPATNYIDAKGRPAPKKSKTVVGAGSTSGTGGTTSGTGGTTSGTGGTTSGTGGTTSGTGGTTSGTGGTTTAIAPNGVIYLDFDGIVVSGTTWNANGDITCAPANLTSDEIDNVFQRVATDYAPFNVAITTDENVYNNANPGRRMRVVITESWEWYGQAGGVAFLNSFTWGNNTPCFVFSSLLGYSTKKIAESCSHEAGHTLGLRHQATYNSSGVKTSDYNYGQGSGEIGWAPIMGAGYYQNLSLWHNGPNSMSSTTYQDDISIIAGVLGLLSDDYSNSPANAAALSTSLSGLINSSTDVDFFSVNLSTTKQVSVVPQNVGANNDGGDLDIILNVYNSQGALITTINDPSVLSATTTLAPGSYYLSVSAVDNQYASRYGMISKYTISLN